MKTRAKFAAVIVVIIGTLAWLAASGISQSKTYYKTIAELGQMGPKAVGKRLRVAGDVKAGSIVRTAGQVRFTLQQDGLVLKVIYKGTDPLPDTFRGGAQALADGEISADGVFHAKRIQAKCASKYEAKPGTGAGSQGRASL